jgi:hypothetical protein
MGRRLLGILVFAMGVVLAAWVAYNLLIEVQPEAQGRSPGGAIALAGLFLWVGARWVRGSQVG